MVYDNCEQWQGHSIPAIVKVARLVLSECQLLSLFAGLAKQRVRQAGRISCSCAVLSEHDVKGIQRVWRRDRKAEGRTTVDVTPCHLI